MKTDGKSNVKQYQIVQEISERKETIHYWEWRKDGDRRKMEQMSLPLPLHDSASMATAWFTTGTGYFQKTVICGYLKL